MIDAHAPHTPVTDTLATFVEVARHANCGVWILDTAGRTLHANDACAAMLRTTSAAMTGTSFLDHMNETDRERALALFSQRNEGLAESHEFDFVRSDGTRLSTLISAFSVLEGAQPLFHVGIVIDLEATSQTRHDTATVAGAFELMVKLSPLPVCVIDSDACILFGNSAFAKMVRLPLDQIKRRPWCVLARSIRDTAPGHEPLSASLVELLEQAYPSVELAVFHVAGEPRFVHVMRTPLTGRAGATGECLIFNDLTDVIRSRVALSEERARLSEALQSHQSMLRLQAGAMDATMEGMAILLDERFIYMNPAHAAIYGWKAHELVGQSWRALYSTEVQEQIVSEVIPAVARDHRWRGDLVGQTKQGTLFDVEVSLTQTSDNYLVCCCREIGERKRQERGLMESVTELDRRNSELQDVNRLKDMFLACMSHELRTPLHSILGSAEILSEGLTGRLTDKQAKFVSHITESGRHLLGLINDVLDVAKIGAGQISLEQELLDLDYLMTQAIEMVAGGAQAKRIEFRRAPRTEDAVHVFGDERRIVQILVNLLSNAAKFSPSGGEVEIRQRVLGLTVEVDVEDHGPGILAADMARLFQPFQQLDGALTRRHEGSGLGLYLARQLAHLHGGDVTVTSTPGVGSCFTLTLVRHEQPPGTPYVPH